ncbi:hypothetical protein DFQ26_004947 [Actinomortierella ambigua]|nr:hypothetical protein DFQ26_004947 [Actinomortierella ambigua]
MASTDIKTILAEPDKSSYVVTYLPLMGRSGAKVIHRVETYESVKADRSKFPYGRVPVLEETQPDGTKFVLAEAIAIEHYLAEKYGLLSDDSDHHHHHNHHHHHHQARPDPQLSAKIKSVALNTYLELSSNLFDPLFQKNEEQQEKFRNEILPLWIANHERLLMDNGNNGHYFGDRATLADLTVLNWLRVMEAMGIQMAEDSPLKKLEETIKAMPEWRGKYEYFHPFNGNLGDERLDAAAAVDMQETTEQVGGEVALEEEEQEDEEDEEDEGEGDKETRDQPSKRRKAA